MLLVARRNLIHERARLAISAGGDALLVLLTGILLLSPYPVAVSKG